MSLQQSENPLYHGYGAMVRTTDHKYVYRPQGHDELYVLADGEAINRASDPALSNVRTALRERLLRWFAETSDLVPRQTDRRS